MSDFNRGKLSAVQMNGMIGLLRLGSCIIVILSFRLTYIIHHDDVWLRWVDIAGNREYAPKGAGKGDIAGFDGLSYYLRGDYWHIEVSI